MAGRACPYCGRFVPPEASFCGSCGAQLPPTGAAPASPPRRARSRRPSDLTIVVIVVVVAVVVVVVLFLAVFATAFSTTRHSWGTMLSTTPGIPSTVVATSFPSGVAVHGNWSATGSGWVNFSISTFGTVVYDSNGSSGRFSFLSVGTPCTFEALSNAYESVTIEVYYNTTASFP